MTIYTQIHKRLNLIAKKRQTQLNNKGTIAQINSEQELQRLMNKKPEHDTEIISKHLQNNVSDEQLKSAYNELSNILTKTNRTKEAHVTSAECVFKHSFQRHSKVKLYSTFWISNLTTDIFIPKYRLAIEIDGGIHNSQPKMRKDDYKDQFLGQLNIIVAHVDNRNVKRFAFECAAGLRRTTPLDSRACKRLMRKVYIITLTRQLTIDELSQLFNLTNFPESTRRRA